MKRVFVIIIEILLAVFIIFALAKYFIEANQYKLSNAEYDDIAAYIETEETKAPPTYAEKMKQANIPLLGIGYEGLKARNDDFIGWLYVPEIDISYPIVYGDDNEYYLHNTFDGESNTAGCIFMEHESSPDFTDYNSFVYGHNMRNGSMFGNLKRLINEEDLYKEVTEFYVYTSDATMKYSIYSFYICEPDSDTYRLAENKEGYQEYLDMAKKLSTQDTGVEVSVEQPTLTLATCSGSGKNKKRFVVHGILTNRIEREG